MIDTRENIFDHDASKEERKVLKVESDNETSYLLTTTPRTRLRDLYFLFLIRNDKINYTRINDVIKNY